MTPDRPGVTALRHSPLEPEHRALGAVMTEFAGWSMPLRFSGDLAEHHAVRNAAGLFDISHMGQLTVEGGGSAALLDRAVVSAIAPLEPGRARYTVACNESGGVVDDLIVYRHRDDAFLVIANAANTKAVLDHLGALLRPDVTVSDRTEDRALLSLQGPTAAVVLDELAPGTSGSLGRFAHRTVLIEGIEVLVARTGYTGEDGFELSVARDDAVTLWRTVLAADGASFTVLPAGLAARDSLRLEAALPLYGHELSAERSPYEAGLGRLVDLTKEFVGSQQLAAIATSPRRQQLTGLLGSSRRSPRAGCTVVSEAGAPVGAVTSGAPSPTLGRPIAFAYLDRSVTQPGTALGVEVRGTIEPVEVVELPFYRRTRSAGR